MKQYPKISVTHFLNKKIKREITVRDTIIFEYGVYYYITIKRRTILKPSAIKHYALELEFENKIYEEYFEKEKKIITSICELYLNDWEENKVNHDIKDLANREFKAKDDFTNGLNSYISYYYDKNIIELLENYQKPIIKDALLKKIEEIIDYSMFDNWDIERIIKAFQQTTPSKKDIFYINNLEKDTLAIFILIDRLAQKMAAREFHLSIMEYKTELRGIIQTLIIPQVKSFDYGVEIYKKKIEPLGIDENYIKLMFVPIIDKIITPEYQLSILNN